VTPFIVADVTVKVIPVPLEVIPPIVPERVEEIVPVPVGPGTVWVIVITNAVPPMFWGLHPVPPTPAQLTTISPRLVLLGELTVEFVRPAKVKFTPVAPPKLIEAAPLKVAVVLNVTGSAFAAPAVTPTMIATANTAKDMLKNFLIVCSFSGLLIKTPPEVLLTG
jgi:hypothetical protein